MTLDEAKQLSTGDIVVWCANKPNEQIGEVVVCDIQLTINWTDSNYTNVYFDNLATSGILHYIEKI